MRSILICFFLVLCCIFYNSCRKDFTYEKSNGQLLFSKDTVYLDTIFSNIGSSTYSLKVYNDTNTDLEIPNIRLGEGEASGYRLNVDGIAGKEFNSIPLLAKDSLYIFIETTLDVSDLGVNEFLYTDAILFNQGSSEQKVELVTLVKDAHFLFPATNPDGTKETITIGVDEEGEEIVVEGFILKDDQLDFTKEKPYVIYGYAGVAAQKKLFMEAGVRVHFHKNSGIIVSDGGSLEVNGAISSDSLLLENEVIFEGDRLEPNFSNTPGQWGGIYLADGSSNNRINHLTIRNASRGIYLEGSSNTESDLIISNSGIYNCTLNALWVQSGNIQAQNLVLGNAGNGSLVCLGGGIYRFVHCTIANYWSNGFRIGAALQLSNSGVGISEDLQAEFLNCIVDGNSFQELSLIKSPDNIFDFKFTNSLIKFRDFEDLSTSNPLYDFENQEYYQDIQLNQAADFLNTSKEDFRLGPNSSAIGNAQLEAALEVPLDIRGNSRVEDPDIGAYQSEYED